MNISSDLISGNYISSLTEQHIDVDDNPVPNLGKQVGGWGHVNLILLAM